MRRNPIVHATVRSRVGPGTSHPGYCSLATMVISAGGNVGCRPPTGCSMYPGASPTGCKRSVLPATYMGAVCHDSGPARRRSTMDLTVRSVATTVQIDEPDNHPRLTWPLRPFDGFLVPSTPSPDIRVDVTVVSPLPDPRQGNSSSILPMAAGDFLNQTRGCCSNALILRYFNHGFVHILQMTTEQSRHGCSLVWKTAKWDGAHATLQSAH